MNTIIIFLIVAIIGIFWWRKRGSRRRRDNYIDQFAFHPAVLNKFREVRPDLTPQQEERVFAALKDYFHLCNRAGRRMVAMPSQVVDDAWHAFILFTRGYQLFCRRAFGRFLHHTPAEAMSSPNLAGEGIKRAWRLACAHDGIDPKNPKRLPLLFAIDADLNIENGFFYTPDCKFGKRRDDGGSYYCGSHIGCASGCGGDSGAVKGDGNGGFFDGFFGGDGGCGGDSGCGGGCGGD